MNDVEQDHQSSSITPIPNPTAGAGSAELSTSSNDPVVLRALLERARERLLFYESYDRMIGENIRRTGELMLDSIALRDEARAQAERADNARTEIEERIAASRREHQALVRSLLDEVVSLRSGVDQLQTRLSAALGETTPSPTPTMQTVSPPVRHEPTAPELDATTEAMEAGGTPLPSSQAPFQIDVIVQGVSKAATALSLQRFLGDLDAVIGVEAREFAEGILRLQVTAKRSLSGDDLASWPDGGGFRVSQEQPRILEVELSPNAA